jgi:hypothetical protein
MATTTVTLEPRNIAASVKSLNTEFAKANISGVKTITKNGAVYVSMPIARLSEYQFSSSHGHCWWKTPNQKVVIQSKGFAVEQQIHNKAFYVVFRLAGEEPTPTAPRKVSAIRRIFFQRSLRAIEELQSLDEKKLAEAVQAPTDYSVLLSALNTEEALASIRSHDPLAGARLRGLEAKRKLVEGEGGALSTAQIAKALRITRQAVDRRRKERKLLAVELGRKGFRYPAWQIGLPHLEEVLDALGDRDSWEQIAFFLNPSALLEDRTPLEVLQEQGKHDIDNVLRAASVYGEQGA